MGFCRNVDVECEYRGISRKELAAAAQFSVNTISSGIKRDGMPEADLALRISKVLGVSIENLLGETEDCGVYPFANVHQRQKLINTYMPYIQKLEKMPKIAKQAILTLIEEF